MTRIAFDVAGKWAPRLFTDDLLAQLEALGELVMSSSVTERGRAEIVITGWGSQPFGAHREPGSPLALISHSAGTIRPFVAKSLLAEGVRVTQAAAGMARSVAEHALGLTLTLLRSGHQIERAMSGRDWEAAAAVVGHTIQGARVGVVGASRVGRAYIELVVALGAQVRVFDPYLSASDAAQLGVEVVSLVDVLSQSQVIAVHAPVTPETRGMIGAAELACVSDGGMIVNTARSAIIDTPALRRELLSGRLSAALDVFDVEPLPADDPFWGLPNAVLTPHLGAVTEEGFHSQGRIVVDEIQRFVRGEPLRHEVRLEDYDRLA